MEEGITGTAAAVWPMRELWLAVKVWLQNVSAKVLKDRQPYHRVIRVACLVTLRVRAVAHIRRLTSWS